MSYKAKKVISIGVVSELTGLSERQIRYYEERKLITPERSKGGTRKYSFDDVETLIDIANKMGDGLHTYEIRKLKEKERKELNKEIWRKEILKDQIEAHFNAKQLGQNPKRFY